MGPDDPGPDDEPTAGDMGRIGDETTDEIPVVPADRTQMVPAVDRTGGGGAGGENGSWPGGTGDDGRRRRLALIVTAVVVAVLAVGAIAFALVRCQQLEVDGRQHLDHHVVRLDVVQLHVQLVEHVDLDDGVDDHHHGAHDDRADHHDPDHRGPGGEVHQVRLAVVGAVRRREPGRVERARHAEPGRDDQLVDGERERASTSPSTARASTRVTSGRRVRSR